MNVSYRKWSGVSGFMSSRTMIAPGPPLWASLCRTTRPSSCRSIPAGLGQLHRLAGRSETDEGQHVARQLHSGSRARLAGVHDHRGQLLERRLDPLVRPHVGTHHHRQLALLGRTSAAADGGVDDVNALGLQLSASSTAVSELIVEWMAMTVPAWRAPASSPTTSRTCSSLSTVTLMMSAHRDPGDVVGQALPRLGQRGHRLRRARRRRSAHPASRRAAWPSAHPCCPARCTPASGRLAHDRMICPPSTLKI